MPSPSRRARTRFAPAPTGFLHLGHVANALWVWGGLAAGAAVLLRVEDHDRQRSREGFAPRSSRTSTGSASTPTRVRAPDGRRSRRAYEAALASLGREPCMPALHLRDVPPAGPRARPSGSGPVPGACRTRLLDDGGASLRVALGDGTEGFDDLRLGRRTGVVASHGDLVVRDRERNWSYAFAVVVDDSATVDLVVRGEDSSTRPLARSASPASRRETLPTWLHHPLIRNAPARSCRSRTGHRRPRVARRRPVAGTSAPRARLGQLPAGRDDAATAPPQPGGSGVLRSSISQRWSSACQAIRWAAYRAASGGRLGRAVAGGRRTSSMPRAWRGPRRVGRVEPGRLIPIRRAAWSASRTWATTFEVFRPPPGTLPEPRARWPPSVRRGSTPSRRSPPDARRRVQRPRIVLGRRLGTPNSVPAEPAWPPTTSKARPSTTSS